jgi:hypothetical protein
MWRVRAIYKNNVLTDLECDESNDCAKVPQLDAMTAFLIAHEASKKRAASSDGEQFYKKNKNNDNESNKISMRKI